jgi:uncharacterized protein YhfF
VSPLPRLDELVPKLRARGVEIPAGTRVGGFGDSIELSQELLALIRNGRKRATASLLWAMQAEPEAIPRAGEIEVVVDHRNEPAVVMRYVQVDVMPFCLVPEQFAAREGEGDGSLEHWRRAHWSFFSRECQRIGREPSQDMPVVCASFEVVSLVPLP